jgi:tetratricopeptide (TPR) repeat protein
LGVQFQKMNRPSDAEPCYRQDHRIYEKLAADSPRNLSYRSRLGLSLGSLACVLADMGQHAEANKLARQCIALAEKLVVDFPNSPDHQHGLTIAYMNLGRVQYRDGDYKAAVASLKKALEFAVGNKAYGAAAGMTFDKEGESEAWLFLAMAHGQLGHQDEARSWYDQAVQWMEKNQPRNEELRRFRTEAEQLLKDKSGDTDKG